MMQMIARAFMGAVIAALRAYAKPLVSALRGGKVWTMSRELINTICAALPGATVSDPWGGGHDAWKVGGKMFACIGASETHGVDVKCPDVETARLLIDMGVAERAPYLHASWVRLPYDRLDEGELRHRLTSAYRTIRAGLTKKLQATLGDLPPIA
jgi:predicted DNA-binding protein (MmcQ/YjbR family)